MGLFLFWFILPYVIATFARVAHKRLGSSERPKQEALAFGRELAKITRDIVKPVTPKKGQL